MKRHRPLDKRGKQPVAWQATIRGNGDLPPVCASRHRINGARLVAGVRACAFDVVAARDPVNHARALSKKRTHAYAIEIEPPGTVGRDALRIDRDHFQITSRPETENAVVRAHRGVLSA